MEIKTVNLTSTHYFMRPHKMKILRNRSGFTLIELLTVIAIIAVLASLLLTALASAKKKSRTMTCTSNLHQFTLALDMYLEDSAGKRPVVNDLVTGKYLPSPQSLICPEDKTGDWGQLLQMNGMILIPPPGIVAPLNYSYLLYPLNWSDAQWKSLISAGNLGGVAACQLHGLGNQDTLDVHNYSGLLLRAQLDGSVIRRQFFWSPLPIIPPNPLTPTGIGGPNNNNLYPLQIYFDDPANWQSYQ
jgi:prepilin-type N-terminal cleavage/methylation domain-containing protein